MSAAEQAEEDDPLVDLIVEAPDWRRALPELEALAVRAAEMALQAAELEPAGFSVSLLACDDDRIAGLNAEFRGRPAPTNVLSWPAFSLAPAAPGAPPPRPPGAGTDGGRVALGDVALALGTVVREAEERGLPLKNHAMHLILHGCLHLLGYDHETPQDAELMEDVERRALARAGIPDPYQ